MQNNVNPLQPTFTLAANGAMPELVFTPDGLGGCDFARRNQQKLGHTVLMSTRNFLRLAKASDPEPAYIAGMAGLLQQGNPIAFPYLQLRPDRIYENETVGIEFGGDWFVTGHEGRHRSRAIQLLANQAGQVPPRIPVVLYVMHEGRPIYFDEADLGRMNGGLHQQETGHFIAGPLFDAVPRGQSKDWSPC